MELTNEFEVATGLEEAWRVLTDVERIAPCLPGAELREIEGEEFRGIVKVKVGPITAEYKGAARFVELDADAHRAVLRAEGRETRGQGNASATITAQLEPSPKGTKVSVVTDLSITGKVAQFGRGVLAEVSAKLLSQFVNNLESTVLSAESAQKPAGRSAKRDEPALAARQTARDGNGRPPVTDGDSPEVQAFGDGAQVRTLEAVPADPVDLLEVAGGSIARRFGPVLLIAGLALIAAVVRLRRRAGRGQRAAPR